MTETATAERSTVDTGPVDQLADWLVRFLVVFITMRIPGSLFVAAACSVLLLMILPLRSLAGNNQNIGHIHLLYKVFVAGCRALFLAHLQ